MTAQYAVGDVITLTKGDDRLVREVLLAPGGTAAIRMWPHDNAGEWVFLIWLVKHGWQITSVTPKPAPLPGAPGWYQSTVHNNPSALVEKGLQPAVVQSPPPKIPSGKEPTPPQPSQGKKYLVALAPVDQTRLEAYREVVQRLRETADQSLIDSTHMQMADWIEREFALTEEGVAK